MALFKKAGPGLFIKARPSSLAESFPRLAQVVEGIPSSSDEAGGSPEDNLTYLDKGSKVSGKLIFDGPAQIDGEIEGEITSSDGVAIGEDAVVSANIKAVAILVAGAVSGELSASQSIEIYPSAKVLMGSLTAPEMFIGEGAVIEGTRITRAVRDDRTPTTSHIDGGLVAEPQSKQHARRL